MPALPLQWIWQAEPALSARPLVLVSDDSPQGRVEWACERARAQGILPGHRYAHALSLCADVCARTLESAAMEATLQQIITALHAVAPRVARTTRPDTLWLDGDALTMYPDDAAWGRAVHEVLTRLQWRAVVVVGRSQFATFAVARVRPPGVHLLTPEQEGPVAGAVPLHRLDVSAKHRQALARLGVHTVGDLVALPSIGVRHRFGDELHQLIELAKGAWQPFVPTPPPEPLEELVVLDDDETDLVRLLFVIKPLVDRLLVRVSSRGHAILTLHLEATLRVGYQPHVQRGLAFVPHHVDITPAVPTLDSRMLLGLLQLRLSAALPATGVRAVRVWADVVSATREQLSLFAHRPRRSLRAANEALAKVRAELGDGAVVCAVPRAGHLPEATFVLQPVRELPVARAQPPRHVAVRRLWHRPFVLPGTEGESRNDGWLLAGRAHGPVVQLMGPFVISGGWWIREVAREYHFAQMRRGDWLWIYFDRMRKQWLCHGEVE